MANHRAERRTPARRSHPAPTVGKRRAEKPGRASRSAAASAVVPTDVASTPVVPITPVPAPAPVPPIEPSAVAATPKSARGGHAGGRKKPFRALPSAPSLVGATALALAAVGALVSQQQVAPASDGYQKFATQASVLNSASTIGSSDALSGRRRAVSRDSQREALQDAASQQLQAAAESQAEQRNAALAALAASAEKHAHQIAANAWHLPVASGVYHLTSRFGECSFLWANCHTGLDFAAPTGTPIESVANGVVTEAGYSGSYGNRTIVTLEDGTELWYCHQNSIAVSVGDTVRGGQLLGYVGSTGNTTGPHLHLEVHPGAGDAVDPFAALVVHDVTP